LKEEIAGFPHTYIKNYRTSGAEFDLISHTFSKSRKDLRAAISQSLTERGYAIYLGEKEESIFSETKEKAKFIQESLKGRDLKKGEMIEILVPRSNAIVSTILEDLKHDVEEFESEPSVDQLQGEIDDLVISIYGLEADKESIKKFLEKF